MTELPETLAPIHDLGEGDALRPWRWLVGPLAETRLLTAMGDIIAINPIGSPPTEAVFLLDTYVGTFKQIALTWANFKVLLGTDPAAYDWFKADLVAGLRERGMFLTEGQCYSPIVPPVVGGSYELSNLEICSWRAHLEVTGQIAEKSKDLPKGTVISGFSVQPRP